MILILQTILMTHSVIIISNSGIMVVAMLMVVNVVMVLVTCAGTHWMMMSLWSIIWRIAR